MPTCIHFHNGQINDAVAFGGRVSCIRGVDLDISALVLSTVAQPAG